jgi:adenylosuccinate lyase
MSSITAIGPVDGRYSNKTEDLVPYFSEMALFKYRVWIEVEYFIALMDLPHQAFRTLNPGEILLLQSLYQNFSEADALEIKEIEKVTNHDVKAVEYFIKDRLQGSSLEELSEFVHFGLTSQDVNNTAVPMSMLHGLQTVLLPQYHQIMQKISQYADTWKNISMLSRTHGQPATPTTMGKEWAVYAQRLKIQMAHLESVKISAKFGGATGAFNAHKLAFPAIDWNVFAEKFVGSLGLTRSYPTTQIDHYDQLAALFDAMKRVNVILLDFCKDVWQYISQDFFKQKIKKGEVGSSAMPHKVNPIDFENAEGNLGLANALLEHLSSKLPISRLQRDLTDSTVLRNVGLPYAYIEISLKSIEKGLDKLILNEAAISKDLDKNWAVVAEAIQTILRRERVAGAYELLKDLTRTNEQVTQQSLADFIQNLPVSNDIKAEMLQITPFNYIGYSGDF